MKNIKDAIIRLFLNSIPIALMIALILFISNDYLLLLSYTAIISIAFFIRYQKHDTLFFVFGFVVMTISEYVFVSTGVETFTSQTLFGKIPIWLPLLWAYIFVAIKRSVLIIER